MGFMNTLKFKLDLLDLPIVNSWAQHFSKFTNMAFVESVVTKQERLYNSYLKMQQSAKQ